MTITFNKQPKTCRTFFYHDLIIAFVILCCQSIHKMMTGARKTFYLFSS